jgi:dye decolorizing peroxidase
MKRSNSKVIYTLTLVTVLVALILGFSLGKSTTLPNSGEGSLSPITSSNNELSNSGLVIDPLHQQGITEIIQPYATYLGMNLTPEFSNSEGAEQALRLLSMDAESLMNSQPVLGTDPAPVIASTRANLTITIGFGTSLYQKTNINPPKDLISIPSYKNLDNLDPTYNSTDLIVIVSADDQLVLNHAIRNLSHDLSSIATIKYAQNGFRGSVAPLALGEAHRTLMGWMEGIESPDPTTFKDIIWSKKPESKDGTYLMLRRIFFDLDKWEELDLAAQDLVIGRTRDESIPIGGKSASEKVDCGAVGSNGLKKIPSSSHVCAVSSETKEGAGSIVLRRSYNYMLPGINGTKDQAGLIFSAFTSDPKNTIIPMLNGLNQSDALNAWNKHEGSAMYYIPPAPKKGQYIGQGLFND